MSSPATSVANDTPSLFETVTGQTTTEDQGAEVSPCVYRIENSVLPLTFARVAKKPRVTATRTVVRVLIVSIRVLAGNRYPEALTFVPVFLTEDNLVLEPSTCDVVGSYEDETLHLNPTFVQRHECGKSKVRNVHVKFDLSEKDLDFRSPFFDDSPNGAGSNQPPLQPVSAVSRKMASKCGGGKQYPPLSGKAATCYASDGPNNGGSGGSNSGNDSNYSRSTGMSEEEINAFVDATLVYDVEVPSTTQERRFPGKLPPMNLN